MRVLCHFLVLQRRDEDVLVGAAKEEGQDERPLLHEIDQGACLRLVGFSAREREEVVLEVSSVLIQLANLKETTETDEGQI